MLKSKQSKMVLQLLFLMVRNKILVMWLTIYSKTPWYQAIVLSAWCKYKESDLYRQRWIEFNRPMAAELYSMKEHLFFVCMVKLDKELMKKIKWSPYSILRKCTEEDDELRQYIKL